jgi:hypothetical protein
MTSWMSTTLRTPSPFRSLERAAVPRDWFRIAWTSETVAVEFPLTSHDGMMVDDEDTPIPLVSPDAVI